jgi:hypothetical protein
MKRQWLAYVIVGVLSIGAGVAIAGLPDNVPVAATIVPPSTTEAPETTLPEPPEPSTTTSTTPPTTSVAPATTAPPPDTTVAPAPVLPERSDVRVAVANGANIAGAAARFATLLEGIGYVDVSTLDGTGISETSVVYHADGLELLAARLAVDLQLPPTAIAPLATAPPVDGLAADTQLLAYIGRDLA